MTIDDSPSAGRDLVLPEAATRTTRIWRIVLRGTAFETIAELHPRFGRLKDGAWVPNYSEIARQGGISKQHLGNAIAGRDCAGEAVLAALLGIAASYGLAPHLVWGKLFELVRCDPRSESMRKSRHTRRPHVAVAEATESAAARHARARIRTWAWEKGRTLGDRGPIPDAIVREYLEKHPEDREALQAASQPVREARSGVSR